MSTTPLPYPLGSKLGAEESLTNTPPLPIYTDLQPSDRYAKVIQSRADFQCPYCGANLLTIDHNSEYADGYYDFWCPACKKRFVLRIVTVVHLDAITVEHYREETRKNESKPEVPNV